MSGGLPKSAGWPAGGSTARDPGALAGAAAAGALGVFVVGGEASGARAARAGVAAGACLGIPAGGAVRAGSASRRDERLGCSTGTGVITWGITGADRGDAATAVAVAVPPPLLMIFTTVSRSSGSKL